MRRSMLIRILIVDDHAILRTGLRVLLDAQPDMEVVGEASDGAAARAMAGYLQPDIVLLDITMPGMDGIETTQVLLQALPSAKILILTMHKNASYLRQLLELGASGYVVKDAVYSQLLTAIRSVSIGGVYVDPTLAEEFLSGRAMDADAGVASGGSPLSERESQVVQHVALGYTNRETAERLDISEKTVEVYRRRVMQKLGVETRAQLVRYAIDGGLIDSL